MARMITLMVHTGFCGATHEEEVEYTGQSDAEIEELLEGWRDEVVANYIETEYEIKEEDEE